VERLISKLTCLFSLNVRMGVSPYIRHEMVIFVSQPILYSDFDVENFFVFNWRYRMHFYVYHQTLKDRFVWFCNVIFFDLVETVSYNALVVQYLYFICILIRCWFCERRLLFSPIAHTEKYTIGRYLLVETPKDIFRWWMWRRAITLVKSSIYKRML
jgi:hypothetical protein